MTNSDTPRTESVIDEGCSADMHGGLDDLQHYMASSGRLADLARQLERELSALRQASAESLRRDAERYRWLRSADTTVGTLAELVRSGKAEDRFDAAIDAARIGGNKP